MVFILRDRCGYLADPCLAHIQALGKEMIFQGMLVTPTPPDRPVTPPRPDRARSMMPLILILLISLAPVVFALLAYYVPSLGLRPAGTDNYGALIQPQRPMPDNTALPLTDLDGSPFQLAQLRGKWLLISADDAVCPESCVRKLFILRNSHASQGKEVERLSRIWFVLDDGQVAPEVLNAYQGTHMLRADPEQLAGFLAPQASPQDITTALKAPMWIIDPLGNLMMAFPPDADPLEVRDDIRKLLRASRIG